MRTLTNVLIMAAMLAGLALGQNSSNVALTVSGTLTASGSGCEATNCVQMSITSALRDPGAVSSAAAWQISGTFSATVQFEGTADGTNWAPVRALIPTTVASGFVTSATAPGIWQANAAGLAFVRVRCSSYTSGSISVTLKRSAGAVRGAGSQ